VQIPRTLSAGTISIARLDPVLPLPCPVPAPVHASINHDIGNLYINLISDIHNRKLVIIGDGACGKTSLLSVFTLGYFPTVSSSFYPLYQDLANRYLYSTT
jgi:hypothetical protein